MTVTNDLSIVSLISQASAVVQFIMALLAALSLISWYWIFRKWFQNIHAFYRIIKLVA